MSPRSTSAPAEAKSATRAGLCAMHWPPRLSEHCPGKTASDQTRAAEDQNGVAQSVTTSLVADTPRRCCSNAAGIASSPWPATCAGGAAA